MTDLATLFARDPQKCSKEDVRIIVAAYRERRKQFQLGHTPPAKPKAVTAKTAEALKAVSTSDIDL